MNVILEKGREADTQALFDMQRAAFLPLLEKYQDFETSPANETIEQLRSKITDARNDFLKIWADGKLAGGICIKKKAETCFQISPLFILPEYQGHGIAQKTIRQAEMRYPEAEIWTLFTLLEEPGNCYLYEKMGYIQIGQPRKLTDSATLVHYQKGMGTKLQQNS
ncbi:GNAT family N-acetyltransferase [Planomicrobium sp. CPCC 101110]|uniref:GNAT family N-acetyltransferase n=1 Tax=Planomicrobium sp. CPCC 101110 TaxID=2599619 RepID=UPI0011B848C0|nr:GNAT family N-acetyltransferase [Planomicrobium sp. CPCC 101110]TWT28396.1 GNAT family N-acetyltransferase [Planomicrobium sp. CPCC 101110]